LEGADELIGGTADNTLDGGAGNDVLWGRAGQDTLSGGTEADMLNGEDGQDQLLGGDGLDTLSGGPGDDTLTGGTGADALSGGVGTDVYELAVGDGTDTIQDTVTVTDLNVLRFGAGILSTDLTYVEAANTLTITYSTTGDQVQLTGFDREGLTGSLVVSTLQFADGSQVNMANLFPGNRPPTVANPIADQTAPEDAAWTFAVPANTFADQDAGDVLTYGASLDDGSALPSWLSFDSTSRTFTGIPDDAQVGTIGLQVTATDGRNETVSDTFNLTVTNVNESPTVAMPLADQAARETEAFSFIVPTGSFTDPDVGDVLTYSATLDTGAPLPTWLTFNPTNRTFSGTPQSGDVGSFNVRVTTTDTGGLSVSDLFAVTVELNHTFTGTPGDDTLIGTAGDDVLNGLAGNDVLNGLAGSDVLDGGAGNDQLTGGDGVDTLIGGTGDDAYVIRTPESDTLIELPGEGVDWVYMDLYWFTLPANVEGLQLNFTDSIGSFAPRQDGTGNDLNNTIYANHVLNTLRGGAGDDYLDAGGNISLAGYDKLYGEEGNDTLTASVRAEMYGGPGDDTYILQQNLEFVLTEAVNEGSDTIQSPFTYVLTNANVENLTLTGFAAINGTGNTLNNVLDGSQNSAANVLTGDVGNDTYVVGAGDTVSEKANAGTDTVVSALTYTLGSNLENLILTGTANINGTGNSADNVLTGNSGANVLTGGTGNDTYVIDSLDTIVETSSGGTDTVQTALTYTLGTNFENLTLTGTAAINGTGNTLNNVLTGNSAANTLNGLAGNDTLDGGAGSDTLVGGAGNDSYAVYDAGDVVTENVGEGTDTVQSTFSYTLGTNLENLTLVGTAAINATGNTLNNTLTGNGAVNMLNGGAGADAMSGGGGDDTYIIDNTSDTVTEAAGAGIDTVQSSVTYTLAANVENLTLTGTGAINGTGNGLDNVLAGNSAANTLTGGAGNDTYVVGAGDTVAESNNNGTDTVQSSVTWTLGSNVENLTLIGTAAINGTGNTLNNILGSNAASNVLTGLAGNDTYLVDRGGGPGYGGG